MQAQCQATLTQPLQCVLQRASCKTQKVQQRLKLQLQNRSSTPNRKKKTILKHFSKGFLKGKLLAPKWRKSTDKSLSQPSCSHSNTIYEIQLQKTIVLRMQPQCQATLTQPLQCDLQHHVANLHVSMHVATSDDDNHAAIPLRSATTDSRNAKNYRHSNNRSLQNTEEEHIRNRNDHSRNRRTHEVPFITGCSHFARKNSRFRSPASSPKQSPLSTHAAITMRFAASRG